MRKALPVGVKGLLLTLLVFATNHGLLERFGYLVSTGRLRLAIFYAAVWVLGLFSLLFIGFSPALGTRFLWSLPLIISALLADIHHAILQVHLDIDSVEAYWNMRFWAGDAVGEFGWLMLWPALRAVCFLVVVLAPPVLPRLNVRRLAFLPAIPILLIAALVYLTGGYGIAGFPGQFSTLSLVGVFGIYDLSVGRREPVQIQIARDPGVRKIVLIMDESVRGDFVDLGPSSQVTPYLASQRTRVVSYGIASAGSNCSQASNAMLRMGANPHALGVNGDNIMRNPSIWKYARAAGYDTTFLDAQATGGILINYMNQEERSLVDHFVQITAPASYEKDRAAARRIRETLRAERAQFIYVNKMGVHYNYENRYPPGSGPFQPTPTRGAAVTDRGLLLNSYRNAIRWSVDQFFTDLLQDLDLQDAVIIYTSDHGQNLLEDGKPVTHCRAAPTVHEAMVPLLVMTQNEPLLRRFNEAARRNEHRASHFQIFPTVLELFGYDADAVRRRYHLTLFDDVPARIGVTSGAVFGRFGVPPRWTPLPEDIFGQREKGMGGSPGVRQESGEKARAGDPTNDRGRETPG